MNIRTIEDGFQYQIHQALRKFAKDFECEKEFEEDAEAACTKYQQFLLDYFLDRVGEYCGIQGAYDNKD